ncbi:UMP kinase [Miniphocaeibacter massiliensis]|uniref:UMP kinase n=1 Tax=Miniphocaeibacter massiliensis TaxID=2041841 RepID=UPI000C06AD93|nr:UMP kinase [Miniphocaeibacter massiliensis]
MELAFKRVIIKLSGEALSGGKGHGLDDVVIENICKSIKEVHDLGLEIAIVVGGGNFWRGRSSENIDRSTSDSMGMLGTVINALRLQASLENLGVDTRVQTAIEMKAVAEPFIRRRAIRHIEKKRILIFGAGAGLPYFSTDTTAALRAAEINADVILLGKTGTDGIYNKDPNKYDDAVKYDKLSYIDILNQGLSIMDSTATSLCMDNNIPLIVFGIDDPSNLIKVACGENIGTTVGGNK